MTVEKILGDVLDREGWPKFTVHPADRGGPTKGGITLRTFESWRGRRCTRKELQKLKKAEAVQILRRRFVESNGIQRLSGNAIQSQVVDNAILSGPYLAIKDLQRALDIAVDGICGPVTQAAVEAADARSLCNAVAISRALRLARFTAEHPKQLVFLVGWLRRALDFVDGSASETVSHLCQNKTQTSQSPE
jgi:lysozyme family protein